MSERVEALRALKSNVQMGEYDAPTSGVPRPPYFNRFMDAAEICFPQRSLTTPLAWRAYKGSLSAACALHEALLPGADWSISPTKAWAENGHRGECPGNPARAWLIAILSALIAVEEQSQ